MYWMLECNRSPELGGRGVEAYPRIKGVRSWILGERFTAPIPQPIVLYWDPNDEQGPPKALYKPGIPMMTKSVHKVLLESGVDNLDVYPIQIRSHTSKEVNNDFLAFNIIGLVKAVDLGASGVDNEGAPPLLAMGLTSVAIDPARVGGALMFRLAEKASAIVIADSVKQRLAKADLGLTFVAPENWGG